MIYRDRKSSIEAAFQKLEDAAKNKEEELKKGMSSPQFSPLMEKIASNAVHRMTTTFPFLSHFIQDGENISRQVIQRVRQEADLRPWVFLGKVALCSFGVGLLLGTFYKRPSRQIRRVEIET
jgi:hypothetical protein